MIKYLRELKKEEPKEIVVKLESGGITSHTSVNQGYQDVFSQLKWHNDQEDDKLFIKEISNNHIVLSTLESKRTKDDTRDVEELEKVMIDSMDKIEDYIRGKAIRTTAYMVQDDTGKVHGVFNEEVKASLVSSSLEEQGYSNMLISPIEIK